ncbi:hypothetical protein AcV5_002541 [Taiwanofungus camphoratus]|nr:hypothetical protein AcV5_002541 [Antrodia cinnamomea]KAI0942129.1 hypothetical protein AcV7_002648 [Antrodia cinnamomea]
MHCQIGRPVFDMRHFSTTHCGSGLTVFMAILPLPDSAAYVVFAETRCPSSDRGHTVKFAVGKARRAYTNDSGKPPKGLRISPRLASSKSSAGVSRQKYAFSRSQGRYNE